VQTTRMLDTKTLRNAELQVGRLRSDQALAKLGKGGDPYAHSSVATVDKLAGQYLEAGCPKRDGTPRTGKQLKDELRNVANVRRLLGKVLWTKLNFEDLEDYHVKRVAEIRTGSRADISVPDSWQGHRSVEIEERALSSMLRWAVRHSRKTGVTSNPIAHDRPLHCHPEKVRHCRDSMPPNVDTLNAIANLFFETEQTEVLGWLVFFEAMLGSRSNEIIRLQITADTTVPGHIDGDFRTARLPSLPRERCIGNSPILQLYESETTKGTFQYGIIHKALGSMLEAFFAWHQLRYPKSKFYFPAPKPLLAPAGWTPGSTPIAGDALTRALRWAIKALGLPRITSHGLRAYFANVLRTHGVPDHEVALLMGHTTRGQLVVDVYGTIPKSKLTWLPIKGLPAWSRWIAHPALVDGQLEFHI